MALDHPAGHVPHVHDLLQVFDELEEETELTHTFTSTFEGPPKRCSIGQLLGNRPISGSRP